MRKRTWMALACVLSLLLCGCEKEAPAAETAGPETSTAAAAETVAKPADPYAGMTDQEKAVAQCRAVLDSVQSGDSYHITLTKWHEGTWDFTNQIEYYRHGEDRAMTGRQAGNDVDGQFPQWMGTSVHVRKDGVTYSGYSEDNKSIDWEGRDDSTTLDFDPWMCTFDWDAQEVELTEIRQTGEGHCVSYKVHDFYDILYGYAEDYTITFYFDENDNFLQRELVATAQETTPAYREVNGEWVRLQLDDPSLEKTGRIITRVDYVTVESLDPESVGGAIDGFYQDAVTALEG